MIEIQRLSSTSIDGYLKNNDQAFKNSINVNWLDVKSYLLQIYDIGDLMTRPMLLKMIVKTLLSGKLDLRSKHINIGPASLYELYTSLYLDIDYQKGTSRQLFSVQQRRSLSVGISLLMFEQRSSEVSYQQLLQFIAEHTDLQKILGDINHLTFEQVVSDIQICTFLVASDSGKFRFAHKSFMEFFVARYFQQATSGKKIPSGFFDMLPKEILYFIGSFSATDISLETKLSKWLEKHAGDPLQTKLTRNLASAILYGGANVTDLNWKDFEISHIEFKRRSLRNVKFEKLNFQRVEFINAGFYNNTWCSVYLRQVNFTSCEVDGAQWSTIIEEVSITGGEMTNCLLNFSGTGLVWNSGIIVTSSVSFSGTAHIVKCTFKQSTLNWDERFPGEVQFLGCIFDQGKVIWPVTSRIPNYRFAECKFIGQSIQVNDSGEPSRILEKCSFVNCSITGLRLDVHMLKTMLFIDCSGYIILEDRAVQQQKDQLEPFKQKGNLLYFKSGNLNQIPETTWRLCNGDFKQFLIATTSDT